MMGVLTLEHIRFLEEQRRNAVQDVKAHRLSHRGRFAGTVPCFMDSGGVCHGIGENFGRFADEAIKAHQAALVRYANEHVDTDR